MTSTNNRPGSAAGGRLERDHPIPLHSQLAAWLEAGIRDGHLGPGSPLPATRDLARRLGVHRSTVSAAYARLRRRGWASGGAGGRLRVRAVPRVEPGSAARAEDLAAAGLGWVLAETLRHGVGRTQAIRAAARVARRVRADPGVASPVMLFEPRPGLRRAIRAELERRLRVPVSATRKFPRSDARVAATILIRSELAAEAARRWPGSVDTIPLHVAGGTRERGLVRRIARGGLVTLVSVSPEVRVFARELAAREFGRGISFAALDPSSGARLVRSVAASRLVLFDEPSRPFVPPARAPAHAIRLLTGTQMAALRAYLGAEGGARPGT